MMGNFTKKLVKLGMGITILAIAFALLNIIPGNSVNAAKNCRADAVNPEIGPCTVGDGTCIRNYCQDINFLKMQGFFDNKIIDENEEEQNENNKGNKNNPEPECLGSRVNCRTGTSSSSSSFWNL